MTVDKYQEEWLEREWMGYGMNMPNPEWPKGAKVCVSLVVQYYMGAENGPLNGDEMSCTEFNEIPIQSPSLGRNEGAEQVCRFALQLRFAAFRDEVVLTGTCSPLDVRVWRKGRRPQVVEALQQIQSACHMESL